MYLRYPHRDERSVMGCMGKTFLSGSGVEDQLGHDNSPQMTSEVSACITESSDTCLSFGL